MYDDDDDDDDDDGIGSQTIFLSKSGLLSPSDVSSIGGSFGSSSSS